MPKLSYTKSAMLNQLKFPFIKLILFILMFLFSNLWLIGQTNLTKQDTISISIDTAESVFLRKNLILLSQKYNVDATKALIIQARLWPNLNASITQAAYNHKTNKWFETDPTNGEQAFQLSQLILLAGKIKKQVKIAETTYLLSEYQLYDMLRSLKFGLRNAFFNIYFLQQTAKVYDEEISSLKVIVHAFELQLGKNYVSQADMVRVQAQLYSLQSEYQTLIDNINDQQSQLRLLLQTSPNVYIVPLVDIEKLKAADPLSFSVNTLLDLAYINRTDLMIAKGNLLLSQQNYILQKAMAIPDITVELNYDKLGSYITNSNTIGLDFNIPIFNRNQGNIKSAKIMIDYNATLLESTQKMLEEQVMRGIQKALDADKLYKGIDPTFASRFDDLAKAMVDNYMKRYVNLLTFLSFYDSYKQNIVQLNTIENNKISSLENINFLTGTNFFNK